MKIRVLRIINRFNLGGPTYNATFLSAFIGDDYETLLCGGSHEEHEGDSLFIPEKYGLKPRIIQSMQRAVGWREDREAIKEIRAIIQEFKPHIVHTHASKAGAVGRIAASKERVPIILHTFHGHVFHSYFGKLKTTFYKNVERYLAKKSDAIITISPLQFNEICKEHKIVSSTKARVIPLGFDLSKFTLEKDKNRGAFRQKYAVENEQIAIGIIGRLAPIKNHTLFLKAIEIASQKSSYSLKIFIIGDGELRNEIKEEVAQLNIKSSDEIVFTSWIKNIEFALAGLDLVVLSSLNEGTPVSLIEAQAAGVPVISTNVGGVEDVIKHQETGIIVNSFDPNELADSILELTEDEEKREKMSQNGFIHVKDKFDYTRLCKDVDHLYKELLKTKGII